MGDPVALKAMVDDLAARSAASTAAVAARYPVDLRRTVPVRFVEDIDDPGPQPGDMMPMSADVNGVPWGYGFRCPGCGAESILRLRPAPDAPAWTVTAGDPRTGVGLSLAPSIHHTTALGGCGWHGFLTNGVLAPC